VKLMSEEQSQIYYTERERNNRISKTNDIEEFLTYYAKKYYSEKYHEEYYSSGPNVDCGPGFDFDAWIENDILSTIPPCAIAPEFYAYAVCAQCHSIIRIDTDVLDALTYTMSPRTTFDSFCPVCEENSHYMCDGLSWLNITNIPDECVVELCKDAERLTRIDYVDLE